MFGWDYGLEQWINSPAGSHHSVDAVMAAVASWSEPIFIGVVALWFVLGWWHKRPKAMGGAVTALLASGAALAVNSIISQFWSRPRPFITHAGTVHLLLAHSADASFPSDHAAAAFAISGVLFAFHRRLGALALLFSVLVMYARVYVGDHYPTDVLAGMLIGLSSAVLLMTVFQVIPRTAFKVAAAAMARLSRRS
jgi:undecaprenyl-diphosphatase